MSFLGYSNTSQGYIVEDIESNTILLSEDVHFKESDFISDVASGKRISEELDLPIRNEEKVRKFVFVDEYNNAEEESSDPYESSDGADYYSATEYDRTLASDDLPEEELSEISDEDSSLRRSTRVRRQPERLTFYLCADESADPTTYQEAIKRSLSKKWENAMDEEMSSLVTHDTFEVVDKVPKGFKAIPCKWVYKTKRDSEGKAERYKARLVAKGFKQRFGIDYDETFAPVLRGSSARILLTIAATLDYELVHLDVKTAFLNGVVEEEIYMEPPPGSIWKTEGKVWKLKKCLYGLKQAPKQWHVAIDEYLKQNNFKQMISEPGLYVLETNKNHIIIGLYVDDLIVASKFKEGAEAFLKLMNERFEMSNLGPLSWYLGMKITRDRSKRLLYVSQGLYVREILKRFKMEDCTPTTSPLIPGSLRKLETTNSKETSFPYRQAVGMLMYLMVCSRPDLSYSVTVLSRYNNSPKKIHVSAIKQVLRYLKGTRDVQLILRGSGELNLTGYNDSDWNDIFSGRSMSGYVFLLNKSVISWKSKLQTTTAISSTEAEYMSLSMAMQECIYLRQLLGELMLSQHQIEMFNDNQSCIKLAKNPIISQRTKHINLRHHFIREEVIKGHAKLVFVPSTQMLADGLTKAVGGPKLSVLREQLRIQNTQT